MRKVNWFLGESSEFNFVSLDYDKLSRKKSGQSLLKVLRCLFGETITISELQKRAGFRETYVRNLVRRGEKKKIIEKIKIRKQYRRGKPTKGSSRETGRPSYRYTLTAKGKQMMRDDQEIKANWSHVIEHKTYFEKTDFDVYQNLENAIRKHPQLKTYSSDSTHEPLVAVRLEGLIFRPFILGNNYGYQEKQKQLCEELFNVISNIVGSGFVLPYYLALIEMQPELDAMVNSYQFLLNKMETFPEVQKYLAKNGEENK